MAPEIVGPEDADEEVRGDEPARLVDEHHPVGVAVEADADICFLLCHAPLEGGKVIRQADSDIELHRLFGVSGKSAPGCGKQRQNKKTCDHQIFSLQ